MTPPLRPRGNPQSRFWVIGSNPSYPEVGSQAAWTSSAGVDLDKALGACGIAGSTVYGDYLFADPVKPWGDDPDLNYVWKNKQPPSPDWRLFEGKWCSPDFFAARQRLLDLIEQYKPEYILSTGNLATFALTGKWGTRLWRSSSLPLINGDVNQTLVIPTWDPATVFVDWSLRPSFYHDVARIGKQVISGKIPAPRYHHTIRPTFAACTSILAGLYARAEAGPLTLGVDFETRAGHIACLGIAWSKTEALCIPFICVERVDGYFTLSEEIQLVIEIRKLLQHPNVRCAFQNGLYDCQYFQRWWGFVPNFSVDTMICHHACFSGDRKSLGYLSSLYCEYHVYWKDDGKTWEAKMDEDQLWVYNCLDCCRTLEIAEAQRSVILSMDRLEVVKAQHHVIWLILAATVRGCRINHGLRSDLSLQLHDALAQREIWLNTALGQPINVRSPKQLQELFYTDFGIKPIRSRKGKRNITTDGEALDKIGRSDPLLKRVTDVISEIRSLGVFSSTFLDAKTDWDGRMRSSFNPAGTETYRLSSSQNAFDGGLNFQNIPKGDEENSSGYPFPNIRRLFIPDEGYVWFDMDLDRADLQVVVWESEDEELKDFLRRGVDLHIVNGLTIFGISPPPLDELVEGHPNYPEHKKRYAKQRQFAKAFIHGTNYGGGARTMGTTVGISTHEAETFQLRWFSAHPGIKRWHERTLKQLTTRRYVENAFGYRRYYLDRPDGLLPEALAWGPQSTVANVINRAWQRINLELPSVQVLIQVHDSLAGQFPVAEYDRLRTLLPRTASIEVPYPEPLVIPVGLSVSRSSWGEVSAAQPVLAG